MPLKGVTKASGTYPYFFLKFLKLEEYLHKLIGIYACTESSKTLRITSGLQDSGVLFDMSRLEQSC